VRLFASDIGVIVNSNACYISRERVVSEVNRTTREYFTVGRVRVVGNALYACIQVHLNAGTVCTVLEHGLSFYAVTIYIGITSCLVSIAESSTVSRRRDEPLHHDTSSG
jgi:uncharacterized membrane protein YraQ (UPF0718 family)